MAETTKEKVAFAAPTEIVANLKFRRAVWKLAAQSERNRRVLMEMCRRDPVFWVNTFVWSNDPRPAEPPKPAMPCTPFILFPEQERLFLEMLHCKNRDILFEKSRDMGGTYICLIVILYEWMTCQDTQWLLLSRKQDLVDDPNNPSSLFGKLDYMLEHMPSWMAPKDGRLRHEMKLFNLSNKNLIVGESTNPEAGRGGRYARALCDEWAAVPKADSVAHSVRGATWCRIFLSTPKGRGNHFYQQTLRKEGHGKGDILRCRLHWSHHPEYAKAAYYDEAGKIRSPWYDEQCKRMSPMEVRAELDIDYEGSDYTFFPEMFMDVVSASAKEPLFQGEVDYDSRMEKIVFVQRPGGALRLWADIEDIRKMKLVIGNDVSMGTGASNSVAVWIDRETGATVAEYVTSRATPDIFVRKAYAISKNLCPDNTWWIWEANGPGRILGEKLTSMGSEIRLPPMRYYLHREELSLSRTVSELPGWSSNPEGKLKLLEDWRSDVQEKKMVVTSVEVKEEASHYCWVEGSDCPVYIKEGSMIDPSGAKKNHGDRVIATAIAWKYCSILGRVTKEEPARVVPYNSMAARMQEFEEGGDE